MTKIHSHHEVTKEETIVGVVETLKRKPGRRKKSS